jgi:hypothetical protein
VCDSLIEHPTLGQVKIALEKSLVQLQASGIVGAFFHTTIAPHALSLSRCSSVRGFLAIVSLYAPSDMLLELSP